MRPRPAPGYSFLIEVEDTGAQTDIRAKVWPDGEPEPAGYQIEAFDESPDRITSGTVGVWTFGSGGKRFDDLEVLGLPTGGATEPTRLLDESFESYSSQDDPDGWKDTSIRVHHDVEADVLRTVASGENRVYGTESELDDIHSHYYPQSGSIDFRRVEGVRIHGPPATCQSRIVASVLTFFNRYPDRAEVLQVAALGRVSPGSASISTPAGPRRAQRRYNELDVVPKPNTWYRFRVQVEYVRQTGRVSSYTAIRASIWEDGNA